MEFFPTDLFRSILESGQFAETLAARLFHEVCEAVAHLHERSILHRDIKPENVLLTSLARRDAHAKLADFGISRATGACHTYCGTRSYVAPEVVRQRHYRLLRQALR